MKRKFTFMFVMLSMAVCAQQLPNSSFENWTSSPYSTLEPNSWYTLNAITANYPSFGTLQSSDAFDGVSALRLVSGNIVAPSYNLNDTSAVVVLGQLDYAAGPADGFPFAYIPDKLSFYYKYIPGTLPVGLTDTATVFVKFTAWNPTNGRVNLGHAQWQCYGAAVSQYTKKEMPISWYAGGATPDSVFINFTSSEIGIGKSFWVSTRFANVIGNELLIDKLEFSYNNVGLTEQKNVNKIMVYPCPASNYITLVGNEFYSEYIIWDMLGNFVKSGVIVDKTINISDLPQGYFQLQLRQDETVQNTKFLKQ